MYLNYDTFVTYISQPLYILWLLYNTKSWKNKEKLLTMNIFVLSCDVNVLVSRENYSLISNFLNHEENGNLWLLKTIKKKEKQATKVVVNKNTTYYLWLHDYDCLKDLVLVFFSSVVCLFVIFIFLNVFWQWQKYISFIFSPKNS